MILGYVAGIVSLVAGPVPAHLPTRLSTSSSWGAGDGWLAWSQPDDPRDPHVWGLLAAHRGHVVRLRVAPAPAPFDVAVGADASGRTVAVYSRCPRERDVPAFEPRAERAERGCRLWSYQFTTQREHRIDGTHRPRSSETEPALTDGELAFARTSGLRTQAIRRPLAGGQSRAATLPFADHEDDAPADVEGLAVRGTRTLVAVAGGDEFREVGLYLLRGGTRTRLDQGFLGEDCHSAPADPTIAPDGTLTWLDRADCALQSLEVKRPGRRRVSLRVPRAAAAYARDGSHDRLLVCSVESTSCRIREVGRLRTPRRRAVPESRWDEPDMDIG